MAVGGERQTSDSIAARAAALSRDQRNFSEQQRPVQREADPTACKYFIYKTNTHTTWICELSQRGLI